MKDRCSHGVPLFNGDRCIDCEIYWERMTIERMTKALANAKTKLKKLKAEKRK